MGGVALHQPLFETSQVLAVPVSRSGAVSGTFLSLILSQSCLHVCAMPPTQRRSIECSCGCSPKQGCTQQGVSAERSFGRSFRFGGWQFGAKFFAKFAAKFSTKFSALFCWDIQSKKNFSKNFSPKFPWPCTAKLEKFQGKNFMTRFCRGTLAKGAPRSGCEGADGGSP